jgi:hypothetical protein
VKRAIVCHLRANHRTAQSRTPGPRYQRGGRGTFSLQERQLQADFRGHQQRPPARSKLLRAEAEAPTSFRMVRLQGSAGGTGALAPSGPLDCVKVGRRCCA